MGPVLMAVAVATLLIVALGVLALEVVEQVAEVLGG